MQVSVESFGYKHGIPLDADIVMDVRFLPNPHWDEQLRPLTGRDEPVSEFVLNNEVTQRFLSHLEALLLDVFPVISRRAATISRLQSVAPVADIARWPSLSIWLVASTTAR